MNGLKNIAFPFFLFCFFLCNLIAFAQQPDLKFENIGSRDGLPQNTVFGIVRDKYGFMWFGTLAGLCRYDGYRFKVYRFDPANDKSISSNQIDNIIRDTRGNIWISTQATYELCRYNYEKDNFDRINNSRVPPAFLKHFSRTAHGRSTKYSIGGYQWKLEKYSTLVQIDTLTRQKKYYYSNPSNPWALPDPNVSYFYRDAHNLFWVGTFNKGVCKANINAKPFGYLYHDPLDKNSIADNVVTSINRDKQGNLWVGTYDKGISIIGKQGTRQLSLGEPDRIGLSFNQIRTVFCDSRGDIWIGTRKGLLLYNSASGKIRPFDSINLYKHTVHSIVEDRQANVWIASRREGLYKYIASKDTLINYDHRVTLKTRDARALMIDHKGRIWVGTETGGISVLKPVKDTVLLVKRFLTSGKGSLSDNRIYCLYEDKDGLIWIGTGDGLDYYSPRTGKFARMFKGTELSGILVSAIAEDDKGNLWISHKRGITRLNKQSHRFRTFSTQDGLQSNEFSERAFYNDVSAHKLYFGTNNGLNFFDPDSIKTDVTLPRTVLTQLQVLSHPVEINQEVNGRVILTKPLYLTPQLELIHADKSFSIEFAGLHYANPNGNQYAYMLEGFDKEWIVTDAGRRLATYSNLDAGTYTFLVKSSNSDGVWNDKPVRLQIVIKPPFWASTWAYIFYLLVALALIYAYHLYSKRYNRLQNAVLMKSKEQELEKQKLQFFTNISHEIKTPLTLILAPLQKLPSLTADRQAFTEQVQIMKTNADRLLRMINQLLDFRRLETGNIDLDLQRHDLVAFLKHIVISFEPLLSESGLKARLNHEQDVLWMVYDEDKLEKVVSNLLSNAIKFSAAGSEILLTLNEELQGEKRMVRLVVINEGRGIPPEEQALIFEPFKQGKSSVNGGTGLGLAYSRGLVEQHGGTITVACEAIAGNLFRTLFSMRMPMDLIPQRIADVGAMEGDLLHNSNEAKVETEPLEPAQSPDKGAVLINGRVPLLLIVDDNRDLRNYIKQHFQSMCEVMEAANGIEGLLLATENVPDLIISDVMMPEMDGQEFCKRIKTNPETAHIPLILLTAQAPIENEIEGYETGADDYIVKPFNLNHLTVRVKNLLLSRLLLKEKYRNEISLSPSNTAPLSADEKLLQNFLKYVEERISDPELNVDEICKDIGISRSQLYRRIKALTGLNVSDLVKEIRLKRAKQLLENSKFNVSEVAFMVGFANNDHFRKCFKMEFGLAPSEFQKKSLQR